MSRWYFYAEQLHNRDQAILWVAGAVASATLWYGLLHPWPRLRRGLGWVGVATMVATMLLALWR